ncbi:MAG TPA: autotransporter-associated beta strand repeat-containing protein [Verrucomicrobiales bacterium]|nr:autotransporter-associated beta strand repeat-containing protein [Verrucomicrobiales bacterium]
MKRRALFFFLPFKFARLLAPLIAAWPMASRAVTGDWNLDAGTAWSLPANWTGGIIPGGAAGDVANFNFAITAARTINIDGSRTLGTLNINTPAAFAYSLAGNNGGWLFMDNGANPAAINFTGTGATAHTIGAPIHLLSDLEISATLASGGSTFAGNITGAKAVTIDSNGTHSAGTVSAVGDIIFRGLNTYTGGTTVNEARLQAYHTYSIGTGALNVLNGGGIYMPNGGSWSNTFNITGLGWNEPTFGQLGAVRVDANAIFTGNINLIGTAGAPAARFNAHGAGSTIFNGILSGGATDGAEFTVSAANTMNWIVNSNATNAGTMRVGRALASATGTSVLQVGNNNTSGALGGGDILLDAGGVLQFNRTDSINVSNNIVAGPGAITQNGLGTTTMTGSSLLHTGTTTVNGVNSRLIFNPGGNGGPLTLSATPGNFAMANYADLEFKTSSNLNLSGALTGAKDTYMYQSGTGTITLSGAADNGGGRAVVNSGTLVLGKTSTASVHSLGGGGDIGLIINGGTAQLGGTGGDQLVSTMVRMTGGTFDTGGTNETFDSLNGPAGAVTNSNAAASVLTIGAGNSTNVFLNHASTRYTPSFGGVIQDGAGTVGITKIGTGLQTLSGANTYTGPTTISAGTLSVTGSTVGTGLVDVNGGTLAGTGTVGNVTLAATAGSNLSPGLTGTANDPAAVMFMRNLTVNGGNTTINFGAANDLIGVTGTAQFTAANTVTPVFTSPPAAGNTTFLLAGTLNTGAFTPTIAAGSIPSNTRGVFAIGATANTLELQNTGAAAQSLTWTGGTNGNWDVSTLNNWGNPADTYFNLDAVNFTGNAPGNITLAAGLHPSAVNVSAPAGSDYTFQTGTIVGNSSLNKSNTGDLTVNTANTFTGDVRITGGTLRAGNGAALGSTVGQTYVSGGGTLEINGQNLGAEVINISGSGAGGNGALVNTGGGQNNATRFITLTGDATIGGTGRFDIRSNGGGELLDLGGFTLTKIGTNQFSVVGVNVTSGNMVANQGVLSLETTSIIQGTGTITYNPGTVAQFFQTANGNITRPMVMNGNAVDPAGQTNTINSPVTTSGNVTFQGTGTMNMAGSFTQNSVTSLTKNGGSTFNLSGNVHYTGPTVVNAGTVNLGSLNTGASSAVNLVNVPGAMTLGQTTPGFQGGTGGNVNLGGGGYTTIINAPSTVTINNGTFGINTRVSNTIASTVVMNFNGGTNTMNILQPEQDTVTTLTGTIGSSTEYGRLNIHGGNVNLGAGSALNLNWVQVNNNNGAGGIGGTSTGILNITGGDHRVQALYLGDAGITGAGTNSSGFVNMSGGSLTFVSSGNSSLQSTNNSGFAMFGVDGLRIGHWGNGQNVPNQFNLSGGTVDASDTTVSIGWDGAGFLNITGGTLKAKVLAVDGNGATALPNYNRLDVSGGARIELGYGGMPNLGTNSSVNAGDSTWVAVEGAEWTKGMNLTGNTVFDTGVNRIGATGQMVGAGNLTKAGTGILQLGGANINTGAITANVGTLRMGNAQALGDGTVNTVGATLDINGQTGPGAAFRPSSITFGGAGAPGSQGGIINSSGTTGGIGVDAGSTINIAGDTTVYTVGRLEFGTGGAGLNPIINGGGNTLTKTGQNQLIWRGTSASSIGDIVINGGQFYAEENDNSLGGTGSLIVNRGGMASAWQGDGTTVQNKPVVLNGGALMADRNSTWNGGLSVTADSILMRNAGNADAALTFNGAVNLGGNTLVNRDRLPNNTGTITFNNNPSSGNGSLDLYTGLVVLGTNSNWDGTGNIKVRTDALLNLGATATVSKTILLAGGTAGDSTATARTLNIDSTGYGALGSLNPGGTIDIGNLNMFGATATPESTQTAGLTFGSGTGYTAFGAAGATMGSIGMANTSVLVNNPNFTVSSNLAATTNNDTTFAMWDGAKITGVAPTIGTVAGAVATDVVMATAAEAVNANQTIGSLIADQTITINGTNTLTVQNGGVILREVAAAGWNGTGFLTSGRSDGVLAVTATNPFDGQLPLGGGNVGGFTVGNISNNNFSAGPAAFRPVTLVMNGPGNTFPVGNQTFTGGTVINAGRAHLNNLNGLGLGLGPVTIRDGGTVLANIGAGISNNYSLSGLGMMEGGGVVGALRLGGNVGAPSMTGNIALNTAITRLHSQDTGSILGNITGANTLQRTGGGTIFVRSELSYTGATHLGTSGTGMAMGTHTIFSLANGGVPSSLGASSSAASNLVLQSGTLNYIGGGASTDRLFSIAPSMGTGAPGVTIANNGYGNVNFTNTGAIAMINGATDATITLTANNYSQNTFSPSLSDPAGGGRLNLTVNGTGSWTLNGNSYNIGGNVTVGTGTNLILDTTADLTIPILTGGNYATLVKNNSNTLTLGGTSLLAEADNVSGKLLVNSGTVIFDKRGANGFVNGSVAGPGNGGTRISALGANGNNAGDGLIINGGTVRYAPTASLDQIFDNVDVRINGGTLDFNGRSETFDSLNGTGGRLTNGAAGTVSEVAIGANTSIGSTLTFRALANYGGVIEDGAGRIDLIKLGNGVQVLSGANTYTGTTSILNGYLQIDSEDRLGPAPATLDLNHLTFSSPNNTSGGGLETLVDVTIDDPTRGVWLNLGNGAADGNSMRPAAGTTLTFASPIRGNGGLQAVGQGTVKLSGGNLYTGQTAVYRGTLALDYSTQNNSKLADGSALILRGGRVELSGGSHIEVVSSTTIDGATGGTQNSGSSYIARTGGGSTLRLNGITRNMGGTVNLDSGIADTDTGNTNGILAGANAAYATVGRNTWAVSAGTADSLITGLAAGGYAANNFATATNHVDVSGAAAIAAASTVSTLRFNDAGPSSISGAFALTLNQQGILKAPGSGPASIDVTTLQGAALGAAGTTDLIVHQHDTVNALTINSNIANNTNQTMGLTKAGPGTLILTAANTYTGVTHITEGTLELQNAGVLGNNTTAAVWVDGVLSLNRTGDFTINNNMGGHGNIFKSQSGIAILSGGIGTYSGGATVSQGTLVTTGDAFSNANQINDNGANGTVWGTITLGDANTGNNNVAFFSGRGAAHTNRKDFVVANTGSTGTAVIGTSNGTTTPVAFVQTFQGNIEMNRPTTLRSDTSIASGTVFQGVLSGNVGTLTIDAPNVAAIGHAQNLGAVDIQNANTFVGDVVINGAVLRVGTGVLADSKDQIPDTSNVTLTGVSSTKRAGLTINNESETINDLNGDVNSWINGAGGAQVRLTVLGTGSYNGRLTGGAMTLEKAGAGNFRLGGTEDNDSGRVLVTSGTLELAKVSTGSVHAAAVEATIRGGTMKLGGTGNDQIWDGTVVTMYGGTFDMAGTNENILSLFGNNGTVSNSTPATTSTLTLGGNNNGSSLFGGTIANGAGTMAVTKSANGALVLTGNNTYTGATTITGGYVQLGAGGTTGSIAAASNVITSANTQLVFNRSDSFSFPNAVSGAGGLVQNGTGVVELPAGSSFTYTGPTVVNSGGLKVNGNISTSQVTLNPGATLSGTGTTGPVGSHGGIIAPGNSPGIITTGSLVTDSATVFQFEIGGLTAGTQHDQIAVNGLVDLNGTAVVSLVNGFTPTVGQKFLVLTNDLVDAVVGTFSGVPQNGFIPALDTPDPNDAYQVNYAEGAMPGSDGNDISFTYSPVPEPGTAGLAALAGAAFVMRRRRRVG